MVAHLYYVDPVLFILLDADFFRLFTQNGEKRKINFSCLTEQLFYILGPKKKQSAVEENHR